MDARGAKLPGPPQTTQPMHAPRRFLPAVLLGAALLAGCGTHADMSIPELIPPAGATRYATDDASTDRVSLAFADLHASLRTLGEGRWTPTYYQVTQGSDWATLRGELDRQARAAGWEPQPGLSATGTAGYPRAAWTKDGQLIAAALVEAPAGADGATVLMVLTPRE